MNIYIIAGIVLVALIILTKKKGDDQAPSTRDTSGYKRAEYLFTGPEFKFYKALTDAIQGRYNIMVKVRLADIIEVDEYAKDRRKKFNYIAQKHCDFLLCERESMRPLLFIELDDSTHQQRDRQERDRFVDKVCKSAGMPIHHIPVARDYPAAGLLDGIHKAIKQA